MLIQEKFFKIDKIVLILTILFCILVLPLIYKGSGNARILEIIACDEAPITMQLEGMTISPFGNPANFLKVENNSKIPEYWYNIRYYYLLNYGGLYLDFALLIFTPLKWLGAKTFPTAPIILRFVSFLFGLISLITLYLFGKKYWGRIAGLTAVSFLIFDYYFFIFSTFTHPDTLLCSLAFLSLFVVVSHSQKRQWKTLCLLGLFTGFAQGAKSAGPWFLPMCFISIILSHYETNQNIKLVDFKSSKFVSIIKDFAIFGVLALLFFILSTPYSILDDYYFQAMKRSFNMHRGLSPLYENMNLISWLKDLYTYIGKFLISLFIGSFFIVLLQLILKGIKTITQKALLLSLILLCSNVLWYSTLGSYWVQLFYLLPSIGIMGLFIGIQFQNFYLFCLKQNSSILYLKTIKFIFFILMIIYIFNIPDMGSRYNSTLAFIVQRLNLKYSSPMQTAKWADENLPKNSKILHDGMAYFDPKNFPEQHMGTNAIQYHRLFKYKPNILVLTNWLPINNWISDKIKTQKFNQCQYEEYSVRLYQDLIPMDKKLWKVGPTAIPYIDLIHIIPSSDKSISLYDKLLATLGMKKNQDYQETFKTYTYFIFKIDPRFYPEWEMQCKK